MAGLVYRRETNSTDDAVSRMLDPPEPDLFDDLGEDLPPF